MKTEPIEIIIDITRTEINMTLDKYRLKSEGMSEAVEIYLKEAKDALTDDFTGYITSLIHDAWMTETKYIIGEKLKLNK